MENVVGAHQNRLVEAILMSTHNICFYAEMTKIILQLSPNTLPIFSSEIENFKNLTPDFFNNPQIWTMLFYYRVLCPKDTDGMAYSVDLINSLIWVCRLRTFCSDLSVPKLNFHSIFNKFYI